MARLPSMQHPSWIGLVAALAIAIAGCSKVAAPATADTQDTEAPNAAPALREIAAGVSTAPSSTIEELRQRARDAFAAGRLVAPADDNALAINLELVRREPEDGGARQAIADLFPAVVSAAEQALAQENFEAAERLLGLLAQANPESATATRMRAQLLRAQAAGKERLAAANAEKARLAAIAATPPSPENAQIAASSTPDTDVASDPPFDAPEPNVAARVSVAQVPRAAAFIAPAPEKAGSDSATDPVNAVAKDLIAPPAVANADARRGGFQGPEVLTRVNPDYPAQARSRRVSGWVDLEFVVNAEGRAENIRVVGAQPQNMFDRSALRALGRWRFKPAQRNGAVESARLRARINFETT